MKPLINTDTHKNLAKKNIKLLLLLFYVCIQCVNVSAEDIWTTPYKDVLYLHRTTSEPWDIYVLKIDLTQPQFSFVATPESQKGICTTTFADLQKAVIAVNADFYATTDGKASKFSTMGLSIANGVEWKYSNYSYSPDKVNSYSLVVDNKNQISIIPCPQHKTDDMLQVVSGQPMLISEGNILEFTNKAIHPRTAVGLTQDNQTLILALVDGRQPTSRGMSFIELANLMSEMGAYTALNLDGGGSSTMVIRNLAGIVNNPCDAIGERTVANHFGIIINIPTEWKKFSVIENKEPDKELSLIATVYAQNTDIGLNTRNFQFFIDTNTVALWRFDGTKELLRDKSLYKNKISTCTAIQTADGKFGDALMFNGTNYVVINSTDALCPKNQLTVEYWLKPALLHNDAMIIDHPGYQLYLNKENKGYLTFAIKIGDKVAKPKISLNDLNTTEFYYIAGTYNGKTAKIYLNGIEKDTVDLSGEISYQPKNIDLGGEYQDDTYANCFSGILDELRFSNVTRSADEILAQYYSKRVRYSTDNAKTWTVWSPVESGGNNKTTAPEPFSVSLPKDLPANTKLQFSVTDCIGNQHLSPVFNLQYPK